MIEGKTIMKAKMKRGLCALYDKFNSYSRDPEITKFLESIDGKEVELKFTGGDAFEVNDDDVWLPRELWDEIPDGEQRGADSFRQD